MLKHFHNESKYTKTYPCFPNAWDDLYPEFESLYTPKSHKNSLTNIFGEFLSPGNYCGKVVKVTQDHPNAIPCAVPAYIQAGNVEKGIYYIDSTKYFNYDGKTYTSTPEWWGQFHIATNRLMGKAPVRVPEGCVTRGLIAFRNFPEVEGYAAYVSRAFVIWCVCTAVSTSGFVKDAQTVTFDRPEMANVSLYSIKSFPLTVQDVRDGILDRYATMTDREVFEDLWSRYKKLTGE